MLVIHLRSQVLVIVCFVAERDMWYSVRYGVSHLFDTTIIFPLSYETRLCLYHLNAQYSHGHRHDHGDNLRWPVSVVVSLFWQGLCIAIADRASLPVHRRSL